MRNADICLIEETCVADKVKPQEENG